MTPVSHACCRMTANELHACFHNGSHFKPQNEHRHKKCSSSDTLKPSHYKSLISLSINMIWASVVSLRPCCVYRPSAGTCPWLSKCLDRRQGRLAGRQRPAGPGSWEETASHLPSLGRERRVRPQGFPLPLQTQSIHPRWAAFSPLLPRMARWRAFHFAFVFCGSPWPGRVSSPLRDSWEGSVSLGGCSVPSTLFLAAFSQCLLTE